MKKYFLILSSVFVFGFAHAQNPVNGYVFNDFNKNGIKDKNEKGIANVAVSNGKDVVLTDTNGKYKLTVGNDNIIFVIKPSNYSYPLSKANLPQFYYIHKPAGSPKLKFEAVAPTGKLPKSLDFALIQSEDKKEFTTFVFGDPQAYNLEELEYFKKGIVDEAKLSKNGVSFGISLGDLVGDKLSLHKPYTEVMSNMGLTWYNVMGNHDMNYDVTEDTLSDESFESVFGPNNYSFNHGDAHFIVLDNIIYPNPDTGKGYKGGLRPDQLTFIENDLKFVPKDKLIVLAFHIPLYFENDKTFRKEDRQRLFDLLAEYPNTLSLSAHTHFQQQNYFTKKDGWKQAKPHHEYNVGTTSGDWYSGELNEQGVPVSTMRDGTPKGYAFLHINGNQYKFDYKVAGKDKNYQIQLFAPEVVLEGQSHRYEVFANFFVGKKSDKVSFRINSEKWQSMNFSEEEDPNYVNAIQKMYTTKEVLKYRKPSEPSKSQHIWKVNLPKMKAGEYTLEVKAVDMFGQEFIQSKKITVIAK